MQSFFISNLRYLFARSIRKSPSLIILLALLSVDPIYIGHGLIRDLNPHETGAIVLESYFNPNQAVYDNYWSCEGRIFDYLGLMGFWNFGM